MSAYVLRDANVLDEGGGFAGPLDTIVRDGHVRLIVRISVDLHGDQHFANCNVILFREFAELPHVGVIQ